jgi:nucleotide-binding universal stress UspA family protein
MAYTKILLPIDGSTASLAAAHMAIAFAQCQGAQVFGLVVIDPYLYAGVGQASTLGQQAHSQEVAAWAEPHLQALSALCEAVQVPYQSSTLESASVVKGILQAAQTLECNLIALGSRGRGGVSALVLGSVAQKVLAQSPVPVMVLKA